MDRLEQIEKLRETASIGYEEAKRVLDEAGGDLLEAIILLEKQGRIAAPTGSGVYSSCDVQDKEPTIKVTKGNPDALAESVNKLWKFFLFLLDRGNVYGLEVKKGPQLLSRVPLIVFLLMTLFLPWLTVILGILGWGMGYHFRLDLSGNQE